jgi:hypothetical protein
LFFKFGSVVGIYTGAGLVQTLPVASTNTNIDSFEAATDVAWSPTNTITGDADAGWATIPVYNDNGTDFTNNLAITSESGYHSIANVKAGKGDPCRLVGLDLARIKNTAAASLTTADIDNGKWRLPTVAEQQSFTGRDSNGEYAEHWTTQSSVNGGMFPNSTLGDATTFLPAAGYRHTITGQVGSQSTYGHYWSSIPSSAIWGINLTFGATGVLTLGDGSYALGCVVRCVRQ